MATPFERPSMSEDTSIRSTSFGGLNTTASLLNVPLDDSPNLLNIEVDVSGNISKRQGTECVLSLPGTGLFVYPVKSVLGYDYLLMKRGGSLQVVSSTARSTSALKTYLNVWSGAAAGMGRPNFTLISDLEPRVLILTEQNAPVQVKFVEQTLPYDVGGAVSTTIIIPNAERFQYENPIVYVNKQYVGGLFSYNAGTKQLTVSGVPSFTGLVTVDVVLPVWQWWTESIRWFGDRFFDVSSRFHTTKADQSVALPDKLRTDMTNVAGQYGNYPLLVYKNNSTPPVYVQSTQPNGSDAYGWGDGAVYNYSVTNYLNTAPYFATFGDTRSPIPQPAEPIYFIRRRELRLTNDTGTNGDNLQVQVDGQLVLPHYGAGTAASLRAYKLYDANGTVLTNGTNQQAYYLGFEASLPIGVSPTAVVTMTRKSTTFIGSAALQEDTPYKCGSFFRCYGLGLWADFLNGFFPSIACIYQGRLVLSGFKNDPTRVVFSASGDSIEPGIKYNFFQVSDDLNKVDTDPFDVVTTGAEADDYVTGVVEWQSSLFVLTRRATFRVSGGDQPISPSRRFVNYISSLGLVNSSCLVRTDTAVFYLSDSGIFNLTPRIEDGEYQAGEKSVKIRKSFKNIKSQNYTNTAWLSFDPVKKLLFVGVPRGADTTVATGIYVYDTFRDSWSQWDTPGNFRTNMGTPYIDASLGAGFLFVVERNGRAELLRLYGTRYADYVTYCPSFSGNTLVSNTDIYTWVSPFWNLPVIPNNTLSVPMSPGVNKYSVGTFFQTVPYSNVMDLNIGVNGKTLILGKDWFKLNNGEFYIVDTTQGTTLTIQVRCPVNDDYTGQVTFGTTNVTETLVWLNNREAYQTGVYFDDGVSLTFSPSLVSTNIEVGQAYPAYYQTPLFVQQELAALKKVKHALLYFDNQDIQGTYELSDVKAGQAKDLIVGAWKTRANANVTVTYDSDSNGVSSNDIYGFSQIVWDSAVFDVDPSQQQQDKYSLFKEALLGVGYGYQLGVWSYDAAFFKLSAYQITAKKAGSRYTNRHA